MQGERHYSGAAPNPGVHEKGIAMSIRIEVADDTSVTTKSGTSKKNGSAYTIHEQTAYAHVLDENGKPGKYPVKCKVPLDDPDKHYRPGFYTVDPRSFYVGDFDSLGVGRLRLVPIAPAK